MAAHAEFDYGYTIDGICERALTYLNDDQPGREACRWSKPFLRSQILDVLYMAARIAPEYFTQQEKWFLKADECAQVIPENCQKLLSILCISDTKENSDVSVVEMSEDDIKRMQLYPGRCSTSCGQGTSEFSLSIESTSITGFTVYPEPEEDDRYEVTAECVSLEGWTGPEGVCEEVPTSMRHFVAPFVHLVVGMVLMLNRSDAQLISQAQSHFGLFGQLLNLSVEQQNLLSQIGLSEAA